MKSRTNIRVTEQDIERAQRNDSYMCVVAQAIARTRPTATRIEVDTQSIRFTDNGERFWFLTPYAVQGYVVAFDAGDTIEPFDFQLRDPIKVKQSKRTEAGKAADNAARAARRAAEKIPADEVTSTSAQVARVAYAKASGGAKTKVSTKEQEGRWRMPPRVFKTKKRSYGHRVLRMNQQDVELGPQPPVVTM